MMSVFVYSEGNGCVLVLVCGKTLEVLFYFKSTFYISLTNTHCGSLCMERFSK